MKKGLLHHFFLIVVLSSVTNTNGMTTVTQRATAAQRATKAKWPRFTSLPKKTIYYSKTYEPLTWTDRFKQTYNRFKQLLFGPGKTKSEVLDEVTIVLDKIRDKKPGFMGTLDTFLQEHKQEEVNTLLSKLVFSENGLHELNACVHGLKYGLTEGVKGNKALIKKITNWTKETINQQQLFILDLPINEDFFLFTLLELEQGLELIPIIK